MKISHLKIGSSVDGKTEIEIWATCHSIEDVEDAIAWLQLAKFVIRGWKKIRERRHGVKPDTES